MNFFPPGMELKELIDGFDWEGKGVRRRGFVNGYLVPIRNEELNPLEPAMVIEQGSADTTDFNGCVDQIRGPKFWPHYRQNCFYDAVSRKHSKAGGIRGQQLVPHHTF